MTTDADLQRLGAGKYVRLTTFRRDGTPVPTPVWVIQDGADLLVMTGPETGKVKRLRHTPRVLLAPCTLRGKVEPGVEDVEAVASVVDDPAEAARLYGLVQQKYGRVVVALSAAFERLRGERMDRAVEVRISRS